MRARYEPVLLLRFKFVERPNQAFHMERTYKSVFYFFVGTSIIIFAGFYKRYFALAPDFPGLKNIHHFHALALILWVALLVVQPFLIVKKKIALHRLLGRCSYFLAPIVFISLLLVYHNQYLQVGANGASRAEQLAFVFSPATDAIPFIIFYVLAIINKKNTAKHLRYMVASGLIVSGPGFGRIFITWFGMDLFVAIGLVALTTLLVFVGLIVYEHLKKISFRKNPYTAAFIIWLIPNILIIFFPSTALWQSFAGWLVKTV
jgi:hypothetical protein